MDLFLKKESRLLAVTLNSNNELLFKLDFDFINLNGISKCIFLTHINENAISTEIGIEEQINILYYCNLNRNETISVMELYNLCINNKVQERNSVVYYDKKELLYPNYLNKTFKDINTSQFIMLYNTNDNIVETKRVISEINEEILKFNKVNEYKYKNGNDINEYILFKDVLEYGIKINDFISSKSFDYMIALLSENKTEIMKGDEIQEFRNTLEDIRKYADELSLLINNERDEESIHDLYSYLIRVNDVKENFKSEISKKRKEYIDSMIVVKITKNLINNFNKQNKNDIQYMMKEVN